MSIQMDVKVDQFLVNANDHLQILNFNKKIDSESFKKKALFSVGIAASFGARTALAYENYPVSLALTTSAVAVFYLAQQAKDSEKRYIQERKHFFDRISDTAPTV